MSGVPMPLLEMREVASMARPFGLDATLLEIRGAQDIAPAVAAARAGALCRYRHIRIRPTNSNPHCDPCCATTDHARLSRVRRSGRPHVLWGKLPRPLAARRRLR